MSILIVGIKYQAVCENWPNYITPLELNCEANTKIVIIKGDFGRDRYSIACSNTYYDGNCTSSISTTEKLRELCGNKQNCSVKPTPATFGDPCLPGTAKILKAWYQCVGDGKFENFY